MSDKEMVLDLVQKLPEDTTLEQIYRELSFVGSRYAATGKAGITPIRSAQPHCRAAISVPIERRRPGMAGLIVRATRKMRLGLQRKKPKPGEGMRMLVG
jgi:hypothetical protein